MLHYLEEQTPEKLLQEEEQQQNKTNLFRVKRYNVEVGWGVVKNT